MEIQVVQLLGVHHFAHKEFEFDCFPQKDNPSKRIFYDAKLSTTIFFGDKSNLIAEKERKLTIRTYPANSFIDPHKNCAIKYTDLKKIDADNLPIPLIDKKDWSVLINLHSVKNVDPLGKLETDFIVRRGEINQTVYKKYIQKQQQVRKE
ncbi:MAG: hypothetical protein IPJ32_10520 [Sphingobacteriaceae bacterium]|nr:hypothetical protein [Sphingobacteriaceae bacterium]